MKAQSGTEKVKCRLTVDVVDTVFEKDWNS